MDRKNWIKFVIGWMVVFAIRLIPFRPPNVEPVLATQMPFAKRYGWKSGFLFGFLSIFLFDLVTSGIGSWTWITAIAYGLLGPFSYALLKNRRNNSLVYATVGAIGTLLYDAVTGLSVGPLFFGQPFMEALVGQVPFTLMHLAGTVVLSAIVSPLLYRWVLENDRLEAPALWRWVRTLGAPAK